MPKTEIGCHGCKHADWDADGYTCHLTGLLVGNASIGCNWRDEKKPTNGDRIRSMTDEELAEKIYEQAREDDSFMDCHHCVNIHRICEPVKPKKCIAGILEWLKQEAKDDT